MTSNTPLPYVFKISQDLNRQTQQEKLLKLVLTYQLATDNAADSWRTLSIPVEIPSMDVSDCSLETTTCADSLNGL